MIKILERNNINGGKQKDKKDYECNNVGSLYSI
jgi:hypothetical protein